MRQTCPQQVPACLIVPTQQRTCCTTSKHSFDCGLTSHTCGFYACGSINVQNVKFQSNTWLLLVAPAKTHSYAAKQPTTVLLATLLAAPAFALPKTAKLISTTADLPTAQPPPQWHSQPTLCALQERQSISEDNEMGHEDHKPNGISLAINQPSAAQTRLPWIVSQGTAAARGPQYRWQGQAA